VSSFDTTASRFLRPPDVARIRRNQRQIRFLRTFAILRTGAVLVALGAAGLWVWKHTQSDGRFAVRHVEIVGAKNTPAAQLQNLTRAYVGENLFKIDITRVQRELGAVNWVSRIEIEKRLPDTLRIRIVERRPVALVETAQGLTYVDESGVAFAALSPAVGSAELPLIADASGPELRRCVQMLEQLRRQDAVLYSRVSEIRPIAPRGFAVFDRQLAATVYVNGEDIIEKWRGLYGIAAAEGFGSGSLEYADLRFSDRIVVKPQHPVAVARVTAPPVARSQEITN
jgi:cell division protein FtsQ